MKTFRSISALFLSASFLFVPHTGVRAESIGLFGQVVPDNEEDKLGWTVEVSAEMQGSGSVPSSRQTSNGNIYFFPADSDTTVSLIFSRAYYRSKRSPWITVSSSLGNPYRIMPDVTLRRINSNTGSASIVPGNRKSDKVFINVSYQQPQITQKKPIRVSNLRKELEEQAELARASKTADVFQFNLAVYEDVYRDQPEEVKADIVRIKTDEKFKDVAVAPPEREELYKRMVLRDRGVDVEIDENKLFKIATDSSLSPSIRIESVRSMNRIGAVENRENLDFIRSNARNPSSKLNFVSLVQLMKFGEQRDKDAILSALQGTDAQRVSTVLSAMQAAHWKEGSNAVVKLADTAEIPAIKELARETVSKLARVKIDSDRLSPSNDAKKESAKERERQVYKRPPLNDLPSTDWSPRMSMTDAARGAEAELQMKSIGDGVIQIVVNFRNLSSVKAAENYVLWGLDLNKELVRLGEVIVSPRRSEAQIVGQTMMGVFELYVTVEREPGVARPLGPVIARAVRP